MWSKYVTRRLAVQIAQAWNFGWGKAMRKVYGISVNDTLVFRDDKKTEYYVNQRQHERYVQGLYVLLKNLNFLKTFHKQAKERLETIYKIVSKTVAGDLSGLTNKQLLDIYQNHILPNQTQFYIRMWTVFNIGEPLAFVVRNELAKILKDETEVTAYLLNMSSPLVANDVINERKDLLTLILSKPKLSRSRFQAKIKQHMEKYKHIPMFDFDHQPYDQNHFLKQISEVKNPKKELKEIEQQFAKRKKEFFAVVKNLNSNRRLNLLLKFMKENVFLRDHRDMIRQKLNLKLQVIYSEIAKRLNLSLAQVAILTNDEIIKGLKYSRKFSQVEIKQREKAYLLIQKNSNVQIYSGKDALRKAKSELGKATRSQKTEVKGVTGSPGKARGRVALVYTNRDLHKVRQGYILISTMTRQDFVVAIRKAAAIVTDEGSVTAHAAIIARELNIPCVVAAKIATKVFKDGEMVEVDADKGIVRKI